MIITAATSWVDSAAQFLTVLFLFVFVLGATWFTTRYIAGLQKGRLNSANFEVIDTFQLAQNKYAQIIRIGKRYVAIAVCKDNITVLRELDEDEIVYPNQDACEKTVSFDVFLDRAKELVMKKMKGAAKQDDTDET